MKRRAHFRPLQLPHEPELLPLSLRQVGWALLCAFAAGGVAVLWAFILLLPPV